MMVKWAIASICVIGLFVGTALVAFGAGVAITAGENSCEADLRTKGITIEIPKLPEGAVKLEMVLIPEGAFSMGSDREDRTRSKTDWPVHKVVIRKPFYMGKYEVTQAQWEAVVGKHRSRFRGNPNHPVEKVNWMACHGFIKRLNDLGRGTFRLPTEAEWEYACRAGSTTRFSFGDEALDGQDCMWWKGNCDSKTTHDVGLKRPNPWGLYDMHGNVSEWVFDRWTKKVNDEPRVDPKITATGLGYILPISSRVFRGGSFLSGVDQCRSAYRNREEQFDYHHSLGFRVVRECEGFVSLD